ncbi:MULTISPECIES: hypothetical protein [unclassified Bacillus (in: firmicutes)]|uniref:hypothetical protein n=1 Tax=unclassified Bacillus (in: firmicutes) TaxID=185979 RepID=UPI0008E19BEB|nr:MULTISPECIES: hypothetical protein [unclassified Bacillus (in: firmicutes)]SFA80655.1 hypothetical protein SAMN02799634_101961 [Bacillus sp. UNCCL13]SFQ70774.1 hypothetical protein SAMN04488577_1235 [Bacillus sp. cl95]
MKKLLLLLLCIFFLSACSEQESSKEICGYGPMMVVNGKDYLRVPVKKPFKLEKQIGVIKEKLKEKIHPVENFSSNSLEVGTTIYRVEGHENYLLAETKDKEYLLYELIN